jgi:hypothetical protein
MTDKQNFNSVWIGLVTVVIALVLVGVALVKTPEVEAQIGQPVGQHAALITITAGTPVQVSASHIVVSSIMIQPLVGSGAGLIYVCAGIQTGTTPTADCAATANGSYELGAQLAAATSTVPGPVYSFYVPTPGSDLSTFWIDGAHTGDTVLVSWFAHQ